MFPVSCNVVSRHYPIAVSVVNHSLIKTVPCTLLDALQQVFHVLDMVLANAVLQSLPHRIVDGV